jgi:hypothetical protein
MADITSSRFELYDSLAKVYSLYTTLSGDAKLAEFSFVTRWPQLPDEEKRAKYSEFACHELNLFLYHKDPEFFRAVVAPLLENKKEKQFLDLWLLGSDLNEFLQPWNFQRLNVAERILLAQRIAADRQPPRGTSRICSRCCRRTSSGSISCSKRPCKAARSKPATCWASKEAKKQAEADRGAAPGMAGLEQLRRARVPMSAAASPPAPAAPAPAEPTADAAMAREAPADVRMDRRNGWPGNVYNWTTRPRRPSRSFSKAESELRKSVRQLYQKLDKTQEWVENHYYRLPIEQQTAELISVNAFWRDYAA